MKTFSSPFFLVGGAAAVAAAAKANFIGNDAMATQQPIFASQSVLDEPTFLTDKTTGWVAAVNSLTALGPDEFSTLDHPAFPEHSVRIKKVEDCAYSGYIDFRAKHLFFYFFESRSDPKSDPLLMWINGGPGGSSAIGLFMELGPCTVDPHAVNRTVWNPYAWNNNASVFFLDQPVGVGFSYADYGIHVSTTEEAARDVYAFIFLFIEHFSEFKGRALHLSGESYGGRYLPVFASEIVDSNAAAVRAGHEPINLKSVLIGNGWTNFVLQFESYIDMQCTSTSVYPVQSISACVRMKTVVARCEAMLQTECVDRLDYVGCETAATFCETEFLGPYLATGRNAYDISKECEGGPKDLCYPLTHNITQHLNLPSIRQALGVDKAVKTMELASMDVAILFDMTGDAIHDTSLYVAGLLERGIKVLIYAGDYDVICNWIGNLKWTSEFEWTGKKAFITKDLRPWIVDGKEAGVTREADGLTFATVHGAGHMVPYDKPVEALELLNRWLTGQDL
ncbi:hypothetical protein FRB98_009557 [Tulasnella sp. 332]|nr:hypothetical protein FRB98_009557 [Tulasnella sp. 332]